jgi:hypothetical protein
MSDVTFFWIMFAAITIAVFGIGWAREWERRLDAERMLDASEAERLKLRAFHERVTGRSS